MVAFFITFILTNLLFSISVFTCFLSMNRNMKQSSVEMLLYSLGVGPILTTLLLYYLFLLVPHKPALFYFIIVILIYCFALLYGLKYYSIYNIKKKIMNYLNAGRKNFLCNGVLELIYRFIFILFFILLIILCYFNIVLIPLDGTDILEYGNLGKILFTERSLAPIYLLNYVGNNGFVNISYHALSFPLLHTWGSMVNELFNVKNDFYFRSISAYYALLILMIQYYWLSKISKGIALLGLISLLSSSVFFSYLFYGHLDTYRIYFLAVMLIWMGYSIRSNNLYSIFMFGIFGGFAAFAHSIGVFIVSISYVILILFLKDTWTRKIFKASIVMGLILICGGLYYLIDVFFGKGWIFGKALL